MSELKTNFSSLQSSDPNRRLSALSAIFTIASDSEAREEILKMGGGIPGIVACLDTDNTEMIRYAAGAILNMSIDPEGRDESIKQGAMPKILRHLDSQLQLSENQRDERMIEYCLGAVMNMSDCDEARDIVNDSRFDGVRILYDCLEIQNIEIHKNVVGALAPLALSPAIVDKLYQIDQFARLVSVLNSDDEDVILRTAGTLWNFASNGDQMRDALADAGAVDQVVSILLQSDGAYQPDTIANLLMCLSVMSASRKVGNLVRELNALGHIAELVDYSNEDEDPDNRVATSAVAATWNLSHTPENKEAFQQMGIVAKILNFLDASHDSVEAMEKVCGALLTLGSSPTISEDFRSLDGFASLKVCLQTPAQVKLSMYAVIAVAVLGYSKETADEAVESGVVELIIKNFLDHNSEAILEKTTACMLNLTASKKVCTEVREKDGIRGLVACLSHPNPNIQSNAAGALWNMSSVDPKNKAILKNLNVLKPLLNVMGGGKNPPKDKADRTISKEEYEEALNKAESELGTTKPIRGEYEPPVQINDKPRDRRVGLGEHGEEDDLPRGKVLIGAGPLNIARRLARQQAEDSEAVNHKRQINAQRQKEEDDAREEADRKEREARAKRLEEERKQREEEERKREEERQRIEEEKKRVEEEKKKKEEEERRIREQERLEREAEEERQREVERIKRQEEEKKRIEAEEEERRRLLAEQEAMKQKMANAYAHMGRRGVDDEDFAWEDDEDVYRPSADKEEALERFHNRDQMLRDFVHNDDKLGPMSQLTDDERKTILFGCDNNLDWLRENPNATQEQIDEKRRELEDQVTPILARLKHKDMIEDYVNNMRTRLAEDPALSSLSQEERKKINDALDEMSDWLKKNPNATLEDMKKQIIKTHDLVDPIVGRAEARAKLQDNASDLLRNLASDDKFAQLDDKERKTIQAACEEALDFLKKNPNASQEQIQNQQAKFDEVVKPIVDRIAGLQDLEDTSRDMKRSIHQDPLLASGLKKKEKKQVLDVANESEKWANNNHRALLKEIQDKRDQLKNVGTPFLNKAKHRNELKDAINSVRDRLKNGVFLAALLEQDRKKLEMACNKAAEALKDSDSDVDTLQKEFDRATGAIVERADKLNELEEYCRSMKRRVDEDPKLVSLSIEEKKRIKDACQDTLDFLKQNPSADLFTINDQRRKVERTVEPLVNKAVAAAELRHLASDVRRRLNEDMRLTNNVSPDERKKMEIACDNAIAFLNKNPNASTASIFTEKEKLQREVNPILNRAEKKAELEDYASNMRRRVSDDPRLTSLSDKEHKTITDMCDETLAWLAKNPNASVADLVNKQREATNIITPPVSKAEMRSDLIEKAKNLRKRLEEDEKLVSVMSEDDKKKIAEACDELLKSLSNPNITKKEIATKKDYFENNILPIVNRADAINDLFEYVEKARERLNSDPMMAHLTPEERKQLEEEIERKRLLAEQMAMRNRVGGAHVYKGRKGVDDEDFEWDDEAEAIRAKEDAKNVIEPLFNKVEEADKLSTDAHNLLDRLDNDHRLINNLSQLEKSKTRDAAEIALDFLKNNPSANASQIKEARTKMNESMPIIDRVDAKNALEDKAQELKQRIQTDVTLSSLSDAEKQAIDKKCDEILQWVAQNPKSTLGEILQKQSELGDAVDPIVSRAESRHELEQLAQDTKSRVENDKRLAANLSDKERDQIKKKCDEALNWSKLNPKANKGEIDLKKKQLTEAIDPLIEKAEKRAELNEYANEMQHKPFDDDKLSSLTNTERMNIKNKASNVLEYLEKSPNSSLGQLVEKQKDAESLIEPHIERAQSRAALEDAVSDLESRIADDHRLISSLSQQEKEQLKKACAEAQDWLSKNPKASKGEIDQKRKQFEKATKTIVDRVDNLNSLEDYAHEMNARLNEDEKLNSLTDAERQKIKDAADDLLKWINNNPNASSSAILAKRKEADNIIKPLVEKATNRYNLEQEADKLLDRLQSDDKLHHALTPQEREKVKNSAERTLHDLHSAPNMTSSEIDQKRREMSRDVDPIIHRADQKNALNNFADNLIKRVEEDPALMALNDEEKKKIKAVADETKSYLAKNPNASANELFKKRTTNEADVDPLLRKAESSQRLEDLAQNVLKRLDEDSRLNSLLSEPEKKKIRDSANESLDWLNKNKGKVSNGQINHKISDLENTINPILNRVDHLNAMADASDELRKRVDQDQALSALNDKEKNLVKDKSLETKKWVGEHPNAATADIKAKTKADSKIIDPAVSRAEAANSLKEYANQCVQDAERLKDEMSQEEQRKVADMAKETLDWLKSNEKTAPKSDILKKKREVEKELNPIVDKANEKKSLEEYLSNSKNRVDTDDRLYPLLSKEEIAKVKDTIEEANKWKKNNPDATLAQVKQKKNEVQKALDPIINRADEHIRLQDLANSCLTDIDTLDKHLSDPEKREVKQAAEKTLDWLKKNKTSKDAPLVDIISQRRGLEDKVNPILSRGYQKKDLVDYAKETKTRLDSDERISSLDEKEKKDIRNKCDDMENWVKKNPSASVADIKSKRREGEAIIQPLIERAEAHSDLRNVANNLAQEVEVLGDNMSKDDKTKVQDACKDTLNWLDKNKKATKSQVEAKKKNLEAVALPIMSGGRQLKDLEKEIEEYRRRLKEDQKMSNLSDAQKKLVKQKLDEFAKWLKENPNASLEEIARKRNELKQFIDDVIDNQDAHRDLKDYAEKVLKVLEHNKDVRRAMTEKDRQTAKDYAEDALDWLRRNAQASASAVREKKRSAVKAINALRGWKFEVPYAQFVGHRFSEQTRWGLAHNRVNPWELNYGSYLKAQERRGDAQKSAYTTNKPKFDSLYIPPWQKSADGKWGTPAKSNYSQQQDEDEKKFEAMQSKMVSPLLRAKLDSLTDTSGKSKISSGSQLEIASQENMKAYTYAELKDKKKSELPPDVDDAKREQYLSDAEFEQVFGMGKAAFLLQAEFVQMRLKKEKGLFSFAYEG